MQLTNNLESKQCYRLAEELMAQRRQITLHTHGGAHIFFPVKDGWCRVCVCVGGVITLEQYKQDIHEDLYHLLNSGAQPPAPPTVIVDTEGGVVHGVCVTSGADVNVIVIDRDENEQEDDCNVEAREIEGTFSNIEWELLGRGSSFNVVK